MTDQTKTFGAFLRKAKSGMYLEAGHLDGKKMMYTITDVIIGKLELEEEPRKASGAKTRDELIIITLKEIPLKFGAGILNGKCIVKMFGTQLDNWVGKRIVLHPTTCRFGPATVDCIRLWGSPDIQEELTFSIRVGRAYEKHVMHKVGGTKPDQAETTKPVTSVAAPTKVAEPTPEARERWEILGWTNEEGEKDWIGYVGNDYLGHLSMLIDQQDAQEAS